MKQYPYVLIDIDTQNDFLDPRGGLYLPGSVNIIPNLERLFHWAVENHVPVVSTVDSHVPNDPEFREFPAHCVVGTWGHQKIDVTALNPHRLSTPDEPYEQLGMERIYAEWPQVIFQKRTYRVFDNPNIEKALRALDADRFVVSGVATDYCVQFVVHKLLDLRKNVLLVIDAIAAVDPARQDEILSTMYDRGAILLRTSEIVSLHKVNQSIEGLIRR